MSEQISEAEKDLVQRKSVELLSHDTAKKLWPYLKNDQHSDHWRRLLQAVNSGCDDLYLEEIARVIRMSHGWIESTSFQEVDYQLRTYQNVPEWSQCGAHYSKDPAQQLYSITDSQDRHTLESDMLNSTLSFVLAGKERAEVASPNGNTFRIAVIGQQHVGKSALIQQLQRLYQSLPQTTAGESGSALPAVIKLKKDLSIAELPALGLATDSPAMSYFSRRKTFYEVNNVEQYDLIILLVGNRFREDDAAIIHAASSGKHKQPMLIAKVVFSKDPNKQLPRRERDAIETSLMETIAFLNSKCYSNASVFAVDLSSDFSRATFQLNEKQFLERIQMHYEPFQKEGIIR